MNPDTGASAERLFLASILFTPTNMHDVVDRITPQMFGILDHQRIYSAMLECHKRRQAPDFLAVTEELDSRYPHMTSVTAELTATEQVPYDTNAYAERVLHHFRKRTVLTAATDLVRDLHQQPDADPVTLAQAALTNILDLAGPEQGPKIYAEVMDAMQDRIDQQRAGIWQEQLVPTGYRDLDYLLGGGLRPAETVFIGGRPGSGKALALDTPIPTPKGWTTMGDIKAGDWVYDENGTACQVTYATPIQLNRTCYRVVFSDGSEIVADADHRWLTSTRKSRKSENAAKHVTHTSKYARNQTDQRTYPSVVTTQEIKDTLRVGNDNRINHAVKVAESIYGMHQYLPVEPYTLGAWLGDGCKAGGKISKPDPEMWERIAADGYEIGPDISGKATCPTRTVYGLQELLREIGVLNNKHIPQKYLRSNIVQRRSLLSGLLDTDGTVTPSGSVEYGSKDKVLADGVYELVCSLGMQARRSTKQAKLNGEDYGTYYKVTFRPTMQFFNIPRKAERIKIEGRVVNDLRYIVDVIPVESVPVRCITVDSPSHLYLAGESMIPTHNTALALQLMHKAARRGMPVLLFSAEMSLTAMVERAVAEMTGLTMDEIRRKHIDQRTFDTLMKVTERMKSMPVGIDDTGGITTEQMLARARRFARQHGLAAVFFDYVEIAGDSAGDPEPERVGDITKGLQRTAKELDVPIVGLSQLSRNVEQRNPPIPRLSDLRYGGEAVADKVLMLYRQDYYTSQGFAGLNPDPSKVGIADVYVQKNRNGRTGTAPLRFDEKSMRFFDLDEVASPQELAS